MLGTPHEEKNLAAQIARKVADRFNMMYNSVTKRYFVNLGANGKDIRISYSINFLSEVELSGKYELIERDIERAKEILGDLK